MATEDGRADRPASERLHLDTTSQPGQVSPHPDEDYSASADDAALAASDEAEAAAVTAASANAAAFASAQSTGVVATRARRATAVAVAAAAAATAEIAASAAAAVQSEAVARALEAAAAAAAAVEKVAAELPAGSDRDAASLKAAAVAATVSAAVIAHVQSTAEAARTVAAAVEAAAKAAALAAIAAANLVEREAVAAALTGEAVAASTATTSAAAGMVVESTRRVAELTARLRVVTNALRDSEYRFGVTFEHAPVGMMLVSLRAEDAGRVLKVNPALRELTGRTDGDLLAPNLQDLVHVDDQAAQTEWFARLLAGETSDYEMVARWQHADGRDIWGRMNLHAIREGDGRPAYAVGQVEDITERRRAEAALREREERFRLAFENARTGMMFLSVGGGLRRANPAMSVLLGYSEDELLGQDVQSLASQEDQVSILSGIRGLVTGEITVYQAEHGFQHADGHVVWGLMSGSVVPDPDGRPDYLVFQVEDVSARKHVEVELAHQALHDDLTGLPNRLLFTENLGQACARAERAGTYVAVLFIDIDDFKEVNDSLGHLAGDSVLTEVARRLRSCLRETDTAARLGGDEFVIVCEGLVDPDEFTVVVDRISQALSIPVTTGASVIDVTASIGVATGKGSADPDDLLRDADTAMYSAKANGKDQHQVYDTAMGVGALRQLTIASELSHALAHDELRLYYQPTYDLRDSHIVGVEALLRWQHPTRGLLGPAEFLDVAESRRLMLPIGDWVIATACAQASEWHRTYGARAPDMWVNISSQQLGQQHLTGIIEKALSDTGLRPSKLGIEVTERQLIGNAEFVQADLLALRLFGLRLAIDDFGTGFNSLDYLRRFVFDVIKIDRSFISGLGVDRTATAVTASVIALGRSLGLVVVAEGVETKDQYRRLQELECDVAQGFLMQRPAPADVIDMLLLADGTRAIGMRA